jgi:hypothetical protein
MRAATPLEQTSRSMVVCIWADHALLAKKRTASAVFFLTRVKHRWWEERAICACAWAGQRYGSLGVCMPRYLDWTAARLSPVAAYGRLLLLDAATPSNPSTRAANMVGLRRCKTRGAGDGVSALPVDHPPHWQEFWSGSVCTGGGAPTTLERSGRRCT